MAARSRQQKNLLSERYEIVGKPRALRVDIEPPHEPGALRCHPRGTMPRVATLGLDAANSKHGLPRHVDHVAAERESEKGRLGKTEAARADEQDLLGDRSLFENAIDLGEGDFER